MATLWFDALTPKHMKLAVHVKRIAEDKGYSFLLTSRFYDELPGMASMLGLSPIFVGSHGGRALEDKLRESSRRMAELTDLVLSKGVELVVSHGSPEATRIGFGLAAKVININDSPHAEAVARLTVPLSDKLVTTSFVPTSAWKAYGPKKGAIVRYRGLEVVAWVKGSFHHPLELGIDHSKPVVVFRPEETKASYIDADAKGQANSETQGSVYAEALRRASQSKSFTLVVAPRYASQRANLREKLPDALVLDQVVDGLRLISSADIFVGAGGTMTWEAALMGVPTISCFPGRTYVEQRFLKERLLTRASASTLDEVLARMLSRLPMMKKDVSARASRFLSTLSDPVPVVAGLV
ncbi:MAG: DUF354 domain-containing protein [Candidatus Marsarchaeota archaeon]|nr:DUF354 domain-containing protein [Candidatus Marsarchaeota archaeon]